MKATLLTLKKDNLFVHAKFIGSFPDLATCPPPDLPEYAMTGRSNVGKSSLINLLCGQKGLAHVSHKPGKTQSINFYRIDEAWHLVDLPGYGYAQISRKTRKAWQRMMSDYLLNRPSLQCIFVLLDSSVPSQQSDIEFINWLGENQVPFVLVFTKSDKLPGNQLKSNLEAIRAAISEHWNELPQEFITSAEKKTGRTEILDFIEQVNKIAAAD
ncbi:MAG: hypothetical protein RI973_1589 [Bacteroidota bacterium]